MGMDKYIGIIEHEHHTSSRHPRMSMHDRAAQFAPFAALTGYDDVILETGRQTDSRQEMDEMRARQMDARLNEILEHISEKPSVVLTVFEKDSRKSGGRYRQLRGRVRNISLPERMMTLVGDKAISLDDIVDIVIDDET